MGALLGLHPFYVRTSILFDLLHGLHNVFPLSLQNAILYEHSNKDSDSDSDFLILILSAKFPGGVGGGGEEGVHLARGLARWVGGGGGSLGPWSSWIVCSLCLSNVPPQYDATRLF